MFIKAQAPARSRLCAAAFQLGLLGLIGLACSSQDDDAEANEAALTAARDQPSVIVSDPATLMDLENRGLSFAAMMGVTGTSGKALLDSKRYKVIADAITSDLREFREGDPKSGVGFRFEHRQFDPKWLRSEQSRFELIGVVNRIDKRDVASCGDLRFVYRFAYTAKQTQGRLPMTVSLLFPQPQDGQECAIVANRWLSVRRGSAASLLDGPLKGHAPFNEVEINYQAARWPGDARPDLGGQADYILRVFSVAGDTLKPAPLANTPRTDLERAERDELRTWIRDNLDAIDKGTAVVPVKFLAKRATSVAPYGIARLANRPFSQLFPDSARAFADLPLGATKQLGSVPALMRRLDTMTCQGCHQARAIAGFHLLGAERDNATRVNALAVGRSAHLDDDLAWRMQALTAVARKQPFDVPRPFAEHGSQEGGFGAHCGLGDPGFRSWKCASGLQCLDDHGDVVGFCSPTGGPVGDACVIGRVTLDADSHKDTMTQRETKQCDIEDLVQCETGVGFPDGLCTESCELDPTGKIVGKKICGGIPRKEPLKDCIEVQHRPFQDCLAATMSPTFLRTCNAKEPCRDDYACMRVEKGPPDTGACMPPYFAFQARVDGHLFDD